MRGFTPRRSDFLPLSPCGRGWRAAPGEGEPHNETLFPSPVFASRSHPLPQGERGRLPRRWGNGPRPDLQASRLRDCASFARLTWRSGGRPSHRWCDGVEDEPRSKHQGETTMEYYAGIDVSLEWSSVCVMDGSGKIVREAKVLSEPEALIGWFGSLRS